MRAARSSTPIWLWSLAFAVALTRFCALDRLPGINADETWLAVQAQHLLRGEPFSLRTPTHMFVNPMLFLTDLAVFAMLPPSGWSLRAAVAAWSLVGVSLWAWQHFRTFANRELALLTALLYAALPLHVLYARCAWDPSFQFVTMPLLWFPAWRLASGRRLRGDRALLVLAALASLWVHLTTVLALALLGWAAWRHAPRRPMWMWLPLVGGLALALAVLQATHADATLLGNLVERPLRTLARPTELLALLLLPAQMLDGVRAAHTFAGMPEAPWTWLPALALTAVLARAAWRATQLPEGGDRLLGRALVWLPLPWLVASGVLAPVPAGRERYVVWLLVPILLLLTRTALATQRRLVVAVLACVALTAGVLALDACQTFADTQHRALRTGDPEPKIALAAALTTANHGAPLRVEVADWWLQFPLQFLLPPGSVVATRLPDAAVHVWWAQAADVPTPGDARVVPDGAGRPLIRWSARQP